MHSLNILPRIICYTASICFLYKIVDPLIMSLQTEKSLIECSRSSIILTHNLQIVPTPMNRFLSSGSEQFVPCLYDIFEDGLQ